MAVRAGASRQPLSARLSHTLATLLAMQEEAAAMAGNAMLATNVAAMQATATGAVTGEGLCSSGSGTSSSRPAGHSDEDGDR